MVIYGVTFDPVSKGPIVLLKTDVGNRFIPIWIGASEAQAILARLQNVETERPMTHDLLAAVVHDLDAEVVRVVVTDLREHTFFALITLRHRDGEVEVDSRPSDAIALAVRTGAPIFAADDVLERSAVDMPQQPQPESIIEDFKRFLDEVDPQQFGADSS